MNPAKVKLHERHMNEVWDLWDWHFYDKLRQLDYLVRHITKEMGMYGVPPDMWQPFLQKQLADAIEQCSEQAEKEGKDAKLSTRLSSSLTALRSVQARNKVANVD